MDRTGAKMRLVLYLITMLLLTSIALAPASNDIGTIEGNTTEQTNDSDYTPFTISPAKGHIGVWSDPSGADIYLDDVYQGVTGQDWFRMYNVSTGYYTIRLEKSGYADYTETVYVLSGDAALVSAYLNTTPTPTAAATSTPPPTGYIRVWSDPLGADIYLGNVYQGVTCQDWFWIRDVPPGSRTIKLTKSRYVDYTATVHISAGATGSIEATLTKEAGLISISSSPSGADIYLDGAYKGTTPSTIDASPVSHTLKLEKYGYAEWLTSVQVTSGVTGSITAHLIATDVSPPAIRIDKPTIIEYTDNGLLEEGEKVEITYGANDPSGVASIKIMLDGITLESQNQAGTYTVTTNSLSVGEHTIRVRAIDSKSNRGFEELPITVERAGPSVYFGTTRTTIKKGEDAIFTLSAVNPIGNPPMTIQLILKPPNGVSVTSSSFAKAGSGIYTCTQTIESGDYLRSIEVHLTGNEVGAHEIKSEVYYQFRGSPKSPTRYDTLTLVVDERDPSPHVPTPKPLPGFTAVVVIIGLLAACLRRIRP
ncbi:MAG: PEGA domain-containing protein [Euryarchaeota archaeon]|nr:PEGA domain-containing protein [Euryarchaeota archaeon]